MRRSPMNLIVAAVTFLCASPAWAEAKITLVSVPEPDAVTMLALGLAGVVIGRRLAVKRRKED